MSDEQRWEEINWGYWAQRDSDGAIIALRDGPASSLAANVVRIGDEVTANGRMFRPAGTKGVVRELLEPFTKGKTEDVVGVQWQGNNHMLRMKFKDLQF